MRLRAAIAIGAPLPVATSRKTSKPMTTETSKATDEVEIRGLIEAWAAAIRAKDADGPFTWTAAIELRSI